MRNKSFWLVLILTAAAVQLLGRMASPPQPPKKIAPASTAKIDGTDRMRLTLLPEAARRLDIQTAAVHEQPATLRRRFAGEVISISVDQNIAIVQVELTAREVEGVRRDEPAFVLPVARGNPTTRIEAVPVDDPARIGLYGVPGILYYQTSRGGHGLVTRQLVFVELALGGGGDSRRVVPYAAVLYDRDGKTWVYGNPEPFVFVREPVSVDRIEGEHAILRDGPPPGTTVVTVGGAELYGTEFGVGK